MKKAAEVLNKQSMIGRALQVKEHPDNIQINTNISHENIGALEDLKAWHLEAHGFNFNKVDSKKVKEVFNIVGVVV